MERAPVSTLRELALLGLAGSGFLAVAAAQRLSLFTLACCAALYALGAWRLLSSSHRWSQLWMPALLALAGWGGAWPGHAEAADLALAALALITAWSTGRAPAVAAGLAFLQFLAGALLAPGAVFIACLGLFVASAMAALASDEIRRGWRRPVRVAGSPARLNVRLTAFTLIWGLAVLVLAGGLFLLLPRTARLLAERLPLLPGRHLTRLASQVGLGGIGRLKHDERVVLHVRSYSRRAPLEMKWRGSTLSDFDGRVWSASAADRGILRADGGNVAVADDWQRRRAGARTLYRVEFRDLDSDALFVAGTPEFVNVGAGRLLRTAAATFRVVSNGAGPLRYDVSSFLEPAAPAAEAHAPPQLSPAERARYLRLPPVDRRITALAAADTAGAATDLDRASRLELRLREDYGYTLQAPASRAADPLASFLFERRAGHCEYFASAMAVMLRTQGIPARLVTGFQSGVFNPYSGLLAIRASDAHSWVEAFLEGRGWVTFDPTPSAADTTPAWLTDARLRLDAVDSFWRDWVLNYDLGRQLQLIDGFHQNGGAPSWAALWRRLRLHPAGAAAALMALLLALAWRLRTPRLPAGPRLPRRAPAAAKSYARMLTAVSRAGLHKAPWQTPDEFAGCCRDQRLAPLLEAFTAEYLRSRFGTADDEGVLKGRLRAIELHLRGSR